MNERFGELDASLVRTLQRSFGIKKLYNFQHYILDFIGRQRFAFSGFSREATDLCVYVPTGYGKTIAYVLPILQYFVNEPFKSIIPGVHCLVLLPTRELAQQVFAVFKAFLTDSNPLQLSVIVLSGSRNKDEELKLFSKNPPQKLANHVVGVPSSKGPHIIIAVAGRLNYFTPPVVSQDVIDWDPLRFVIVDEADRLLAQEYGYWLLTLQNLTREKDIRRKAVPHWPKEPKLCKPLLSYAENIIKERDSLIGLKSFTPESCTEWSKEKNATATEPLVCDMQTDYDIQPVSITKIILTATNVENFRGIRLLRLLNPLHLNLTLTDDLESKLKQFYSITSSRNTRLEVIRQILVSKKRKAKKVLIFCRTGESAQIVADFLREELVTVPVAHLCTSLASDERLKVLRKFRRGQVRVLVSTDIAARGLHVEKIHAVIHWDPPKDGEVYIHRIGRTARAGHRGKSILMVRKSGLKDMKKMIRESNRYRPCQVEELPKREAVVE